MKATYLRLAKCLAESAKNRLSNPSPEKEKDRLYNWLMSALHYNICNEAPKERYTLVVKGQKTRCDKVDKVILDEDCYARYVSSVSKEEFIPIMESVAEEINMLQVVDGYKYSAKTSISKSGKIKITVEICPSTEQ